MPSLESQRKIWDLYIKNAQVYVSTYEKLTAQFASNPDETASQDWEVSERYNRKSIEGYNGPGDPKFRAKLVQEYKEGVERERAELVRLQKERP